jgi:hypothetical protein
VDLADLLRYKGEEHKSGPTGWKLPRSKKTQSEGAHPSGKKSPPSEGSSRGVAAA